MKIFVVGKNNLMLWPQKVQKTLQDMGHETELFLFNRQTISYCFLRLLGKKKRLEFLTPYLRKRLIESKPDLILFVSTFFMPEPFFKLLNEFPDIQKAGWSGDRFSSSMADKADCLDVLFCSDTGYLEDAKNFKCKSFYLPLCADEKLYKNEHLPKTLPPFFVGVANAVRTEYLAATKVKCLLYGKGWNKKRMPQHEIHDHKIPQKKVQKLLARTKVPINIGFSSNVINGLNFRIFEISCAGGLIMINETKDLKKCYQIGKEAVTYSTPESFNRLLKDIIQQPEKYEKIASAGCERTLREHTYTKRMEQMLEMLKK